MSTSKLYVSIDVYFFVVQVFVYQKSKNWSNIHTGLASLSLSLSSFLVSRWPFFVVASSSVLGVFRSASHPFCCFWTRSFDAAAGALLLSSFLPPLVPFCSSLGRFWCSLGSISKVGQQHSSFSISTLFISLRQEFCFPLTAPVLWWPFWCHFWCYFEFTECVTLGRFSPLW